MIKTLQDFFTSKLSKDQDDAEPSENDLKLAAATLMFEVVRSDGQIDEIELTTMAEVLGQQFKMPEDDISSMMKLAKTSSDMQTSLQKFTREVCEKWGNTERMKLLENLWIIALADKKIDRHERHLVRKVAGLLYLNDKQIVQSREKAKARLATL